MMWTAFILGLGGSVHCLGMCGPIAALVPGGQGTTASRKLAKSIAYNAGRISTYAMFGVLFGWFGQGLFLANMQQGASILFGTLLILGVLFPVVLKKLKPDAALFTQVNALKGRVLPLIQKNSLGGSYAIGLLNGLLPCGLVYVAIGGAILTGTPLEAAKYMVLFGFGTSFALLLISMGVGALSSVFKSKVKKAVPAFLFLVGVLFILRGMNLGIPYISPTIEPEKKVCCH